MNNRLLGAGVLALAAGMLGAAGFAGAARAAELKIDFTVHSSPSNTFWQSVKHGFEDACAKIQANCQMLFTQTEGSIEQQVANMQAAVAQHPDAIITSLVDNNAFVDVLTQAKQHGILVIASNVDALAGPELKLRAAFIGQGLEKAGHSLGQAMSANFPKTGPIHVLVGVSAPGQNWSEQRAAGIMQFMKEYEAANAGRDITVNRMDSGTDLGVTADRVGAYLNAHPDTTAYFDTGYWCVGVAHVLKDRGLPPGKVLLGGFDLVPEMLQQMKSGYVQVAIDQQPFLQGFLPVMMVYLNKTAGLPPFDVDTGQGVVLPSQAGTIMALSKKAYR
jgi:simple sugar transport system substrate-binding protein